MWYNAWIETRWRLVLMLLLDAALLALQLDDTVPASVWRRRLDAAMPMMFVMNAIVLAGSGIATTISTRPAQTAAPSMLFTLSLPISRRRLVLVRMAVGLACALALTIGGLTVLRAIAPELRDALPIMDYLAYGACVCAVVAAAHGVSALFSSVLDQLWQTYAALAIAAALLVLVPATRIWRNTLDAGGATHPATWISVVLALIGTALLAAATVRTVERRQF
jgi:hypothetical protein